MTIVAPAVIAWSPKFAVTISLAKAAHSAR
jgi:hypothetical protein